MTEARRKKIAQGYRRLLDKGVLRKIAIKMTCDLHEISRMTLYRWLKRYSIETR